MSPIYRDICSTCLTFSSLSLRGRSCHLQWHSHTRATPSNSDVLDAFQETMLSLKW